MDIKSDWDIMPINFEKPPNSRELKNAMSLHHCRNKNIISIFHNVKPSFPELNESKICSLTKVIKVWTF